MKIKVSKLTLLFFFAINLKVFAQTSTQATTPPPAQTQVTQMPQAVVPPQQPTVQAQAGTVATSTPAKLPEDFELIKITPYFKNKPRLAKLTATVYGAGGETLGSVVGDFGDCKDCIRGASIKSKIGLRLYGKDIPSLIVSRKSSSSIQLHDCPLNNKPLVNGTYNCEFSHGGTKMRMTLKLEP